jgi:heat shock protein HslJ
MPRRTKTVSYGARVILSLAALTLSAACGDKAASNSGDAAAIAIGDSTPTMAPASSMMANTPVRDLEGPTWRLVDLLGASGERVASTAPATLTFAAGRMTGTTGCNNMLAGYTVSGQSLKVTAGASTKKACADSIMTQEMAMLTHLPNIASYVIASDQLYLVSAAGDNLLIFAPEAAAATP